MLTQFDRALRLGGLTRHVRDIGRADWAMASIGLTRRSVVGSGSEASDGLRIFGRKLSGKVAGNQSSRATNNNRRWGTKSLISDSISVSTSVRSLSIPIAEILHCIFGSLQLGQTRGRVPDINPDAARQVLRHAASNRTTAPSRPDSARPGPCRIAPSLSASEDLAMSPLLVDVMMNSPTGRRRVEMPRRVCVDPLHLTSECDAGRYPDGTMPKMDSLPVARPVGLAVPAGAHRRVTTKGEPKEHIGRKKQNCTAP